MAVETKDTFMARIRRALTDRGTPVELPQDIEVARVVARDRDAVSFFIERVEQAAMRPHRVSGEAAIADQIAEIVRATAITTAVVPDEEIPGRAEIVERLQDMGVQLLDANDPEACFTADLGITGVELAVAETASLSVMSGGARRRLASLAVPCHVAIVRVAQIVPDLLDWACQADSERPANEVLISGPSKTADIEGTIVEGVHGPGVVHVIIVD